MNFQVSAENDITITSTDMDRGQIKTSIRTATWNPENGGVMSMVQVVRVCRSVSNRGEIKNGLGLTKLSIVTKI